LSNLTTKGKYIYTIHGLKEEFNHYQIIFIRVQNADNFHREGIIIGNDSGQYQIPKGLYVYRTNKFIHPVRLRLTPLNENPPRPADTPPAEGNFEIQNG
jgi:hypothetical protein